MLNGFINITSSVYFSIGAGLLLLKLFFCILKTNATPNRRKRSIVFLIGLLAFSLNFFHTQVKQQRSRTVDAMELTLTVLPQTDAETDTPIPLTEEDMEDTCHALEYRLSAHNIKNTEISHKGDKISIRLPLLHEDEQTNHALTDELTAKLVQRIRLELLKVHPKSLELQYHPDFIRKTEEYTAALHRYAMAEERAKHDSTYINTEKHPAKTNLRRLPHSLGIKGYQLAPRPSYDMYNNPIITEEGYPDYSYEIIQTPQSAKLEGIYICEQHITEGDEDKNRIGYANVTLTDEGAKLMRKLTGNMELGLDRIAIVLNDIILCAPIVQSVIDKEFSITGLTSKVEVKTVAAALKSPIYHELKVESRSKSTLTLPITEYNTVALYILISLLVFFGFCYCCSLIRRLRHS